MIKEWLSKFWSTSVASAATVASAKVKTVSRSRYQLTINTNSGARLTWLQVGTIEETGLTIDDAFKEFRAWFFDENGPSSFEILADGNSITLITRSSITYCAVNIVTTTTTVQEIDDQVQQAPPVDDVA